MARRVVWGTLEAALRQLARTGTGEQVNTSYIERLNATFRARLAGLTRRGRRPVKDEGVLTAGMDLVGAVDNFCHPHRGLRVRQEKGKRWRERTPALAAGWDDHAWSIHELLTFRVLHA